MPMPVFDHHDNLIYLDIPKVFIIHKEPQSRKILVTSEDGEYYMPSTLAQIENIMERSGFMKINQNQIINVNQVKSFKNGEVLVDGSTCAVSKNLRSKLRKLIEKASRNENRI